MTDKKNQHYIPKFYLRKFSYRGNEKQIGLYNVKKDFFYPTAPLKNQGSKDFFYGVDGIIEEGLSEIEGKLAETLRQIISNRKVPEKQSDEYINLLLFVGLTHLRNPVIIQNMKDLSKSAQLKAKELDPEFDASQFFPDVEHENAIKIALSSVSDVIVMMSDLDCKLLINRTKLPFISSDFPVVKYNRYLEQKNWKHGKTGYGNTGLQIIVPLNDELAVIFYDSEVYNVGDKKKDYLGLLKEKDIKQLNMLQFLNCFETVYFNEKISETEIRDIAASCSKFSKANEVQSNLHFLVDPSTGFKPPKENLIISGNTEIEIELKIAGINFNSNAKNKKLTSSAAQLRPIPLQLMTERNTPKRHL